MSENIILIDFGVAVAHERTAGAHCLRERIDELQDL